MEDDRTDWPWHLCLGCVRRTPEPCVRHADGSSDETPYQTLTRWGSNELVVWAEDADRFRALLRAQARADRLHVRTYAVPMRDGRVYVIAELTDYRLSEEEQLRRLGDATRGFNWGEAGD